MNASPPPQPRQNAGWTTGLALLSLVLSGLLWITGLVDSLQRPSVGNSLELRQLELTALAAPALPAGLRQALGRPLDGLDVGLHVGDLLLQEGLRHRGGRIHLLGLHLGRGRRLRRRKPRSRLRL